MGDFYIRIERTGVCADRYNVAHDGIESCGLSAEDVVLSVVEKLGLSDTEIGKVVHKEVVRQRLAEADRRALDAAGQTSHLRDQLASLDG